MKQKLHSNHLFKSHPAPGACSFRSAEAPGLRGVVRPQETLSAGTCAERKLACLLHGQGNKRRRRANRGDASLCSRVKVNLAGKTRIAAHSPAAHHSAFHGGLKAFAAIITALFHLQAPRRRNLEGTDLDSLDSKCLERVASPLDANIFE